jgi:acyl carrier protein
MRDGVPMSDIDQRLTSIFRTTFGDEGIVLRPEMTADDIAGWDSVSHIQLIFAVEEEFGIRLSLKDLEGLEDVGALVGSISRHLGVAAG